MTVKELLNITHENTYVYVYKDTESNNIIDRGFVRSLLNDLEYGDNSYLNKEIENVSGVKDSCCRCISIALKSDTDDELDLDGKVLRLEENVKRLKSMVEYLKKKGDTKMTVNEFMKNTNIKGIYKILVDDGTRTVFEHAYYDDIKEHACPCGNSVINSIEIDSCTIPCNGEVSVFVTLNIDPKE